MDMAETATMATGVKAEMGEVAIQAREEMGAMVAIATMEKEVTGGMEEVVQVVAVRGAVEAKDLRVMEKMARMDAKQNRDQ